MPRPHRRDAQSGIHHVMNRGVDRQAIFFSDADRIELGRLLGVVHEEDGVTTLAYCLMGNHLHLLLQAPGGGALSTGMHRLTSTYSHYVNGRRGRDGPLFRGRFHSIPVETDSHLLWAARYIHRNPLDLPGVRTPRDHRWSSYRAYLGLRPVAPFLDLRPVLDRAGGPRRLEEMTEDPSTAPAPEDVRRLVDCAVAVDDLTADDGEPGRSGLARTLTVLLAARAADPTIRRSLQAALGLRSSEASRVALHRAEQRLRSDATLVRALAWLERELTTGPPADPYERCQAPFVRASGRPRCRSA